MSREFKWAFPGFSHFLQIIIVTFEPESVLKFLIMTVSITSSAIEFFRLIKLHFKRIKLDFFFPQGLNKS